MIEKYSFGSIIIDGKEYTSDIIIYPDGRIEDSWWRRAGHRLSIEDITSLIESGPEIIIAGTGAYGFMKPADTLNTILSARGIEFKSFPSAEAVKIYNLLYDKKKTGACFHLTC